jgi:hypothetical protein
MRHSQLFARAARRAALLVIGTAALSACSGNDLVRTFGLVRDAPDEFQVTTRAPLSMPPDFALRPPRPGEARPQEQSTRNAAESTLVPQAALAGPANGPSTAGQQALVAAAGPPAPSDIRAKIASESSLDVPDQTLTERLMFWKPKPIPGTLVDPNKEALRLRENSALGQNVEQGDTPIIQRVNPKAGLFSGIF